jgi:hypothetical protein
MALKLTFACGDYDRTVPFRTRDVRPRNIDLEYAPFDAFSEAKRRAMEKLNETNALAVMLPFLVYEVERTRALMGEDYWPFGIESNRKSISTFLRYLKAQEIIAHAPNLAQLFVDVGDGPPQPA